VEHYRNGFRLHDRVSAPEESIQQVVDAIEDLYPSAALDQRIALSRKDGYWPFIRKGEDPPQEFVYGEFDLEFFTQVVERATSYCAEEDGWKDKVFCDLGSGTGRLVLTAAALYPWRVCRGIELLEGIHQEATETLEKCRPQQQEVTMADPSNSKVFSLSNGVLPIKATDGKTTIPLAPIELKCGSFDDPYEFFGDASLIFVFSSCMNTHVLIKLARSIGRQCQPGCLVLTTEYKLPLGGNVDPIQDDPEYPHGEYALELLESITGSNAATGGESTVYIHRVTQGLGNGQPRTKPKLSINEIAFRAVKAAEDPSVNNSVDFMRRVSNQMAFIGLPESWRPNLEKHQHD